MKIIKLDLGKRSYNIIIGSGIIGLLGKQAMALKLGSDAYIITNSFIKRKFGKLLVKSFRAAGINTRFKLVPDTEKSKSMRYVSEIMLDLAAFDKKKKVFIVAFGGGVIGDLAGFVASVYKRGIPYIQVPTTLLAQVDSSIGGKTAVDLTQGKNLVGAIYQPKLVFSDISFLASLDSRQLRSGLAEVIKYGIIKDKPLFSYLEKNFRKVLRADKKALEFIVWRCSAIKAGVVEKDEKEELGLRTILNFGHTLGHAIESAGSYKDYNHGEAVGLGMLLAAYISLKTKLAPAALVLRIEKLIKQVGLPLEIKEAGLTDIINAFYRDKKFVGARNRMVLVKDIASVRIVENIPVALVKEALNKIIIRRY